MKNCKDCGKEVSKSAKSCPHCGKKLKMSKGLIIFIIIVVLIFAFIAACSSEAGKVLEDMTSTEGLVLEDGYKGEGDEYGFSFTISGHVRNESGRDIDYISITFNAFDEEGNNIGTCLDNNLNLRDGQRWAFSALCLGDVHSYEFVELSVIR